VQAVEANRRAAALAHDRYRNGLGTFLNVLDSPRALLASQSDLAPSEATVSTDVVALYEALGGGWERSASAPCRRRAARSSPVGRTGSADLMA
jgi:outer membrane protein TolC